MSRTKIVMAAFAALVAGTLLIVYAQWGEHVSRAAVQNGKVVGVTVTTEPRDARINACVRRAVTSLRFPRSPGLDVTRTRFDRER